MELEEVHRFLLQAGRLIVECGGETSRVEQSLDYMGKACGLDDVQVFGLPTGVVVSSELSGRSLTSVISIDSRNTHLGRLDALNALSRDLVSGHCSFEQAQQTLADLKKVHPPLEVRRKALYFGVSAACWAVVLGGNFKDFAPALVVGVLVEEFMRLLAGRRIPPFVVLYLGAAIASVAAVGAAHLLPGSSTRTMLVGVVLPLVPGLALTGAIRELMAGDLVSGVARGAEAVLQAAAIAAGFETVLFWLSGASLL